jgi:hypothetical protein
LHKGKSKGIKGLIEEVWDLIPSNKITSILNEKMLFSQSFQRFHKTVGNLDIQEIINFANVSKFYGNLN